jgi:D-beta-D-heptose 7-phosphate kinase/D-beta-D-heptose 1-phosphate adenosyltransferase
MLDHFVYGRVNRISPEAPVPVVEFDHEQYRVGGAGNVAHNAAALGAAVQLVGVVGRDEAARTVAHALGEIGVPTDGLVTAADRPTTRKMRIVTTRNQQVARVDYESDVDAPVDLEGRLAEAIVDRLPRCDVVIVSDYLKGVITSGIGATLAAEAARRGIPWLVDPKIPHIDLYRGATLVTPNHHEAEVAAAMRVRTDEEAGEAARRIRDRAGCRSVLVTRGERGMWLLDGSASTPDALREISLPAVAREVADVTGAGDTVIATIGVALAAGATLLEAAELSNHAAGISVGKFGPATVSPAEVLASFGGHESARD